MKTLKVLSVLLMLSFCFSPETSAQSWKELKKEFKEAKENIRGKKNENCNEPKVSNQVSSNPNDEITLIVSADGISKEEATKIALRNAIEQAYGAFVSANTTILNDEIVKDEIVTISNGNIKDYKEITSYSLSNGNTYITLKATICISKLTSYAKSKGAETEFAGATFGMNMKMKELNKKNEKEALNNLLIQIQQLLPLSYTKELKVDVTNCSDEIISKKFDSDKYQKNEVFENFKIGNVNENYLVKMTLFYLKNENTNNLYELIHSQLKSITIDGNNLTEYKQMNIPYNEVYIKLEDLHSKYYLRSSKEDIDVWLTNLQNLFTIEFSNFKIVDNLGNNSYFEACAIFTAEEYSCSTASRLYNININLVGAFEERYIIEGEGLFNPIFVCEPCFYSIPKRNLRGAKTYPFLQFKLPYENESEFYFEYHKKPYDIYQYNLGENEYEKEMHWTFSFFIPKTEIQKYNNFRVERLID